MKVIRISAMWCAGCLVMKPRWNEVFKNIADLEIIDYDYDMDELLVAPYQVGKIIPVLIFMDEYNQELLRVIGEKSKKELEEIINRLVVR